MQQPPASAPSSRHLVDPELLDVLDAVPPVRLEPETLAAFRLGAQAPPPVFTPPTAEVLTEAHEVPGPPGAPDVAVFTFRPAARAGEPLPCLLHIHGGGYVMGASAAYAPRHQAMCVELDCLIAAVDYRLAPETPAPGPLEDCYAALGWLHREAARLPIDPTRIGVLGESAGGGLAAGLALLARDRAQEAGAPALAFQHLVYPMLDDRTCTLAAPHPFAGQYVWTPQDNRFGWSAYLGREPGGSDVPPYAAPARAASLAGLPPTYLSTGALDLFLEEDLAYAERLMRSGVPTEVQVYPGAVHGFDFHPTAGVAARARADRLAALARALGSSPR